jgi:hypothetical protein
VKRTRAVAVVGLMFGAVFATAIPAGAEVSGPCDGSAEWLDHTPTLKVVASELPEDVIIIPLEGNVEWTGEIFIDPPPTEARPTSGNVKVKVPFPVGTVQVGVWSSTGTSTGNSGNYEYEFPSLLSGFTVTVTGQHWEGTLDQSGAPTCEGEVTLALEGTNPLGFIGAGLSVVSIMGVSLAIRAKGPSAGGRRG